MHSAFRNSREVEFEGAKEVTDGCRLAYVQDVQFLDNCLMGSLGQGLVSFRAEEACAFSRLSRHVSGCPCTLPTARRNTTQWSGRWKGVLSRVCSSACVGAGTCIRVAQERCAHSTQMFPDAGADAVPSSLSGHCPKQSLLQDLPSNTSGQKMTFHSMRARIRVILFFQFLHWLSRDTLRNRPHAPDDYWDMCI